MQFDFHNSFMARLTSKFANMHHHTFNGPFSGTTQVSRYQTGKTNLDETVSGSGISWAICKSAPRSRQIITPAPHHLENMSLIKIVPPVKIVSTLLCKIYDTQFS